MDSIIEKVKRVSKSKLLKNGIWLSILQVFNTVIPMITLPHITRILGAEEYGLFSISLNWIIYLQILVEFGFGLTGARKVATITDEKELQNVFNSIVTSRIVLTVISIVIMHIIAIVFQISIKRYICMLILFVMIIGTTFQLTWLFQGKQDMKFITIVNAIARIISVLLIFICVNSENDIYLYCLLYSITYCISSAISMYVAYKKYGLKLKLAKLKDIKEEIREGKYLFISAAMTKIFSGIGVTLLDIFSTSYFVGIYSAIYKIPYVLTMAFSPFSQALFPYNSVELKKSTNIGVKKITKIFWVVLAIFIPIVLAIVVFRNGLVKLLFGYEYVSYSIIIIPLAIQFVLGMINNFLGVQFLVASGNQQRYSKAFTIGCVGMVIANVTLGYMFKIYGVAISAMLGELVLTIALAIQVKKVLKSNISI